ncbi:ferrochelatase [Salisaeta longa]|uniref:ferrochelatase n=1 Tax=Salisaeta longa TaxID=503170 RepID=UPI0003B57BEF|nr:ferrochelatase [Salisaeta longa]
MTPREFLSEYEYDKRIIRGTYFSHDPLTIEAGDRVGVVMMNLGGPDTLDDVEPFLYNLFMDPAIIDIQVPVWGRKEISLNWLFDKFAGGALRDNLFSFVARKRSESVSEDYEMIGGGSPINRLTREQADGLEKHLNAQYGDAAGATFKTYIAMRYWKPFSEDAARQMQDDDINKVVLLPLYPHYSKTTTGSSLVYWKALEDNDEIPEWPTTTVFEYAAHPKYLQALSERIDEGLQRFPADVRGDVHLLFSAHGTPVNEMLKRRDPYCCLVHSTVEQLMRRRGHDRPFHTAFQSKVGPNEWLTPSTPDKLEELADHGHTAVLVIPVAFVTDHVETSYELDIEVREEAEEFGIEHYEVTSGLNSHPLFIEALAEATIAQLDLPVDANQLRQRGDGATERYDLTPINELPRYPTEGRDTRCPNCQCVTEARCWTGNPKADGPEESSAEHPPVPVANPSSTA